MPLTRTSRAVVVLAAALVLEGCASTARFVALDGDGGIVAIPNNTNTWPCYNRNAAEELIRQRCPDGYVIDREEEASESHQITTTTTDTNTGTGVVSALFGSVDEKQTTQTYDTKEWHIHFRTKSAPTTNPPPRAGLPVEPVPVSTGG